MLKPESYYPITPQALQIRLVEVTCNIAELLNQLHDALVEQQRIRYHTWQTSLETSVAGRERDADIESYAQWCAAEDVKTELAILREEQELLRDLLCLAQHHQNSNS